MAHVRPRTAHRGGRLIGLLLVVLTTRLRVLSAQAHAALRMAASTFYIAYLTGFTISALALVPQPLPAVAVLAAVVVIYQVFAVLDTWDLVCRAASA